MIAYEIGYGLLEVLSAWLLCRARSTSRIMLRGRLFGPVATWRTYDLNIFGLTADCIFDFSADNSVSSFKAKLPASDLTK